MDQTHTLFIAALILCELFESYWQQGPTFGKVLENIERYYRKNIFLLFLMHPSFYLVLYILLLNGGHGALLGLILVMKGADIATKLWMIQTFEKGNLSAEFRAMLSMPIPHWMPWINVLIYPALLSFALF
ncbi:MAG: hypothetical protein L3J42_04555 [Hydrogenimonas sp.]|nr:hypothetical protein [Hydrogenimonas sp.]